MAGAELSLPSLLALCESIEACRAQVAAWRREGLRVGLVPTMGALHAGHLALLAQARTEADRVMVSVFVNPTQFAPGEDYERYPRTLAADVAACTGAGADALFVPDAAELYPQGADLGQLCAVLPPNSLTEQLCGQTRPGHFTGVATVVLKLFNIVQPDVAIFGEKDAQQVAVIRRMTRDLNLPVRIATHPIVREASGLAMSSRNRYLETPEAKEASLALIGILSRIQQAIHLTGALYAGQIMREAIEMTREQLSIKANRALTIEYLEARDDATFEPVAELRSGVRLLVAARIASGETTVRLIDNLLL